MNSNTENILVIKLSALGDFVQNLGIMRAIRQHHKNSNITLLTAKPYAEMAEKSGYFNNVIIDPRPKFFQITKWIKLYKQLNHRQFKIVYDLQINDRTAIYHSFFKNKPTWIGELNKKNRDKNGLAFYRHKEMLNKVGIEQIEIDKMDWINKDISQFNLKEKYALIVPGCAPTRPEKRWSADHFIVVCKNLISNGVQPVILGTDSEKEVTEYIKKSCDQAIDLTGKTKLFDIVPLARKAQYAIGNDTGPMHMIGPTGCATITLFSRASDPERHRPLGDNIFTIQKKNIDDISPDEVVSKINNL